MRYYYFLIYTVLIVNIFSQNSFKALVKDAESNERLFGVNAYLVNTEIGASSDQDGLVTITRIPDGRQEIRFAYVGYKEKSIVVQFPLQQNSAQVILLEHDEEGSEEIIVSATRSSRTIADNPTRVEVISGEELAEKGNMKPGDIRMLLNESTGIQTQQTSAISNNSSIRIQGLDGKYTQILKDGFPLYGSFSGGLSLLQIVPLDLKQVEVIKGSSSTLYGGDAIAGLINLVSKTPSDHKELSFLFNATSALGFDASAFYSNKNEQLGTTLFASYNTGSPYDPADIGFTAIPEFKRITMNPKLFYYPSDQLTIQFGLNTIIEERTGGDIKAVEGNGDLTHRYFEKNQTRRISLLSEADYRLSENDRLVLKKQLQQL